MFGQLHPRGPDSGKPVNNAGLVIEGWIEGFMLGALIVMCCITISNIRTRVLLHKLIFLELLLGLCSGIAVFNNPSVYGWYISATGMCMYISYTVHNVVGWLKVRPFLKPKFSRLYIVTVVVIQPYWVLETYANFMYFNGNNQTLFSRTRPLETVFRDPWWVWTTISLFWNIKVRYDFTFLEIMHISPRFTILLTAMCLSLIFMVMDILAVTHVLGSVFLTGINPFWKLSFIFKCLTDSVILDDFKSVLDKLYQVKVRRIRGSVVADPYQEQQPVPAMVSAVPTREMRMMRPAPGAEYLHGIAALDHLHSHSTTSMAETAVDRDRDKGKARAVSTSDVQSAREMV